MLLIFSFWGCQQKSEDFITINNIDKLPEEIEGCGCYLARNDSLFENQTLLFAESEDSIGFMMINNELNKFKNLSNTTEPFIFNSHNLIEKYSNNKYDLSIEATFEDSTSYESWNFHGVIIIKNKAGKEEKVQFVGACGC